MFDKNLLKSELVLKGLTYESVAKNLNITKSTLSKKINGVSEWNLTEIQTIGKIIGEDKRLRNFTKTKQTSKPSKRKKKI